MNRIDRISAILIQLQSRRVVKAGDIAGRFNISLRTVYRDIKTLEEAGVPLVGEAGVGYSLADGYRLPPVMFTREEAVAFLTAEKLVEKLTDHSNGESYKSAMYKIKSVLRSSEKDFLEHLDKHIEVLQTRQQRKTPQPNLNLLQTILKSISENKVITIHYFTYYRQESSDRNIEPVGVFYLDNYWHLIAWCHLRNDYRDFRLDRIQKISFTDECYRHKHITLKEYLENQYENHDLHPVTIQVDKNAAKYLGEQKYYNGFISESNKGEYVEMFFLTAFPEGFARWFLMFGDHATIIRPESLKKRVEDLLGIISSRLEQEKIA